MHVDCQLAHGGERIQQGDECRHHKRRDPSGTNVLCMKVPEYDAQFAQVRLEY